MIHQHRLQLPTDIYANLLIYAVQHGSNSTESFERSQVLHFLNTLQQNTVNLSALLSSTDKSRLCAILLEQKAWHELLDIAIVWLDQPKVRIHRLANTLSSSSQTGFTICLHASVPVLLLARA